MLSPFFDVLNENMQCYNFKDKLWHRPMMGLLSWLQLSMSLQAKVKAIGPQCNVCALLCTQTESGAVTGGQMLA